LLLNDAVRVPCHEGASPVGKTFWAGREFFKKRAKFNSEELFHSALAGFPALKRILS
jgi:hypothetical protein